MTDAEELGEPPEPSRLAGGCVLAVATAAAGGIAYAVPETGYFVAGLLTAAAVRKTRSWAAGRRDDEQLEEHDEEQLLPAPGDVAAALHAVADPHAHLEPAAERLGCTTAALRDALTDMGVPIAGGVRMKGRGVSTGVRAQDLPPLPRDHPPGTEGVLTSNNNSNNADDGTPREGFRVETIGQAGTVIHDPAERQRRHKVRAE